MQDNYTNKIILNYTSQNSLLGGKISPKRKQAEQKFKKLEEWKKDIQQKKEMQSPKNNFKPETPSTKAKGSHQKEFIVSP
jgi:hypothetical protein